MAPSNSFWRSAFHSDQQLLRMISTKSSRTNDGSKYSNTSDSPPATPPGCCDATARSGAATSAGPQPLRAKPRRRRAGLNLAVLGFDHPGELLQRVDDLVEEIARAGVDDVNGVVHITNGVDRCVRPCGHQIDDIAGVSLVGRELRQARRRRDRVGPAIGNGVEGTHPLGDGVAGVPGGVNKLVELQVQVAEV